MAWLFFKVVGWINRYDPDTAYYLLTGDPTVLPGWGRMTRIIHPKREGDT